MVINDYSYSMFLLQKDGENLGQFPLSQIDWEPAVQWCTFETVRRGDISLSGISEDSVVRPIWHEQLGRPYVNGVQICLSENDPKAAGELSVRYFHPQAQQLVLQKMAQGGPLQRGKSYTYLITAHPSSTPSTSQPAGSLSIEVEDPKYPFRQTRFSTFLDKACWFHDEEERKSFPVFIPQEILDEMIEATHKAQAKETGGILIGYLHQDKAIPEVFAEVTCQIYAQHTQSDLTRLTFTAETWSDVEAARNIRGRDEILLGWWHSHSFMKEICKDCAQMKEGTCTASAAFFSLDDYYVHRTCFPRAYSIAMVISDSPCSGVTPKLFGWQNGQVSSRGFYVLPNNHSEK